MTATRTERIMAAIEVLMAGIPGLGTRIWRDRFEPVAREECPALLIYPENEPHEHGPSLPVLDAELLVQFELSISGRPLSQLADPIRAEIHRRLMDGIYIDSLEGNWDDLPNLDTITPPNLGGLCYDIRSVGVGWDGSSGEIGVVRLRYLLKFRTLRTDLSQSI